jgi:hypothetical protein
MAAQAPLDQPIPLNGSVKKTGECQQDIHRFLPRTNSCCGLIGEVKDCFYIIPYGYSLIAFW